MDERLNCIDFPITIEELKLLAEFHKRRWRGARSFGTIDSSDVKRYHMERYNEIRERLEKPPDPVSAEG